MSHTMPVSLLQARVDKLRQQMRTAQLPAMFITTPVNRRYLSGFSGSSGALLITHDEALLITDFRYMQQAPEQAPHMQVIEHKPIMLETVRELLLARHLKMLGFEAATITYGLYMQIEAALDGVELKATARFVEQLRVIKDAAEVVKICQATKLADEAFAHILQYLRPGLQEREVALELEWFMRKNGATSSSFEIIVASGERSALPHGIASEKIMKSGEFVKLDFGAYLDGYCSDLTRTVILGQASERHREIYELVARAQQHALDGIQPGMTGLQADALARNVIAAAGYGAHFGHGTGHGFGMEIHEDPRLNSNSHTVLESGMTVTVEPGIYIPGFGGVRIEDDVLVTNTGIEILTKSPKSLLII